MDEIENKLIKRREPLTYLLYLGIGGSALFFLSLFYFYQRRASQSEDVKLSLPSVFWVSSCLAIISSVCLVLSTKYLKVQDFEKFKIFLGTTFILGLIFLVLQITGWLDLANNGFSNEKQKGNMYLFLLTGLHVLYTFIGTVSLSMAISKAFRNKSYVDSFIFSVNPPNQLNFKLISIYWHFINVLWIIIFLFLLYHAT